MSLIPYYLYEEDTELPDEGNYYIIARNGVFIHKDCGHTKGIVKADADKLPFIKDLFPSKPKAVPVYICDDDMGELPDEGQFFVLAKNGLWENKPQHNLVKSNFEDLTFLGRIQTKVRFELPKIPVDVVFKSLTFFRRVWYQYKSEAAVVLYYHSERKEYHVRCPRQEVSGGGVRYGIFGGQPDPVEVSFETDMRRNGFVKVGTIHSHCNFSAYHSGVDTGDEAEWPDGVHVTLGHVDTENFSVASSLVMNDNRFQVEPPTVIAGLVQSGRNIGFRQSEHFKVELTPEEKEAFIDKWHAEIEEEWMAKVSRYTQTYHSKKNKWFWQDDKPDPETHVSACAAVDSRTVRICPHCNSVNMEEVGKPYCCKECHKLVEPYPGWAKATEKERDCDLDETPTLADLPTDENVVQQSAPLEYPLAPPAAAIAPTGDVELNGDSPHEQDNFLYKVRSHACALRNHAGHIPSDRLSELLGTLKRFFGKDQISDEDINLACQVDPKRPTQYVEKGYAVT